MQRKKVKFKEDNGSNRKKSNEGMDFGENNTVEEIVDGEKRVYYCDVKKLLKEKAEEYYTCKYCVCKIR